METLAADDRIKGVLFKRKVLTVTYDKPCAGYVLGFCHLDHLRRQVDPGVMLFGIFLIKK